MATHFDTPDFSEAMHVLHEQDARTFEGIMASLNKSLDESAKREKAAKAAAQKKSLIRAALIGVAIGGAVGYYRYSQQKDAQAAATETRPSIFN